MRIDELNPKPSTKVQFKLSLLKSIPREAGCYLITTFNDQILYVGMATNLKNRFKQHLDNSEKINPTKDGKAVWFIL